MMTSLDLRDKRDHYRYWWAALTAIPPTRDSDAYRRLKRIWFDQTGVRAWFANPVTELHLVTTMFENLALFEPSVWVDEFTNVAGIAEHISKVRACRWSYEFDTGEKATADVVMHLRDTHGDAIIVIEAKNVGKGLDAHADRPEKYLDVHAFEGIPRRFMVYLGDAKLDAQRASMFGDSKYPTGFMSWQDFAGLQLSLVTRLDATETLRAFIAGAIHNQWCDKGIRPSRLPLTYLGEEQAFDEMPMSRAAEGAQSSSERAEPLWRLV